MKAIVLAGGQEFGQCPLAPRVPRALWPLLDRPLIEHVLEAIHAAGIRDFAVSANGHTHDIARRVGNSPFSNIAVHYSEDPLPRGAAGCIKDCEAWLDEGPFIVANGASLFLQVDLQALIEEHRRGGAALTVAVEAAASPEARRPNGLYVCDPRILAHIPSRGYQDMKEQLIPRLLQLGLRVAAAPVEGRVLPIRDEESYLNAVLGLIGHPADRGPFMRHLPTVGDSEIWLDRAAAVHPTARVLGPAYIGPGASVAAGATVIGPVVIGPKARVEREAMVHESVLWAGAAVSAHARVEQSLMAAGAHAPAGADVRSAIVLDKADAPPDAEGAVDGFAAPSGADPRRRWWRRALERLRPLPRKPLEYATQDGAL